MKFINYLKTISGISIFPMISLLMFFLFFVILIWYVYSRDKQEILALKQSPLDANDELNTHNL